MSSELDETDVLILDGGLATHLEALGCDLRDELWSARLLLQNPEAILRAHRDFFAAGADVATTASYQASFPALMRRGHVAQEVQALLQLSVELAAQARDEVGGGLVAASVGPYGASLANGAEYTGDYDLDEEGLLAWHRPRWEVLADSQADLLACETIPSFTEARAIARLLEETPNVNAWVSFSCRDGERISDGTPLSACAELFAGNTQVVGVGVNCTAPSHVKSLIGHVTGSPIVVYPNSGETWDAEGRRWLGLADPREFGAAAREWRDAGATLIGGCCRTTPEHIRQIRASLS
ncbi:homocysteine S-methyltransferase YbgG [Sphaerisporangium krabiense]|uniref:S-methylmethionine:homocysteine methyltransferase n=1 Tax=Sphaerisporangium krabiense TaxID=763782 RepID=A0A7W8Z822_9ACTN|nr:homocysteine S-methyltransferase [Sphaerisporangium krabiense]MBB5629189.1 homocysteine S-methyltransferase [Sphaerisporangium krabiense]GII59969.1 homocysteine S-methyltransferase YbgG [Sphaerisporangium krabiense]